MGSGPIRYPTDEEFRAARAEEVRRNPAAVTDGSVHERFGLTYANYLVWRRTLMQSMPLDWQERFVTLARELDAAYGHHHWPDSFQVELVEEDEAMFCSRFTDNQDCGDDCPDGCGEFRPVARPIADPVPHYNRGRTFIPPAAESVTDS